jgi:hypothetical protein
MEQQVMDDYGIGPQTLTPDQKKASEDSARQATERTRLQKQLQDLEGGFFNQKPMTEEQAAQAAQLRQQIEGGNKTPPPPPTEDQSAAETARLQRQANPINPFAAQNDQQKPPQLPPQEEGAVTPPVATLPALTAPDTKIGVEKYTPDAARELGKISKERLDAYKEQGIDPELYNKMISDEKLKQDKFEGRRDEAKGQALMQFGLGLLGARLTC